MNRIIKFRAWDLDKKRWCDTTIINSAKTGEVDVTGGRNAVISQFTGYKDRKGKEIYEGDILKYISTKCPCCGTEKVYSGHDLYTIQYSEEDCGFKCDNPHNYMLPETWSMDLEVIGNVYENFELVRSQ